MADIGSEIKFEWPEYVVFSAVLAVSVAIGIFYGCFGSRNKTNDEYLLGGHNMNPIPVALSLLCSYVSSITLLGHPVEIYLFGTQLAMVFLCYIPLTLSLAYLYVPLYFQLQMTSVFQYLEWRFHSVLRTCLSVINIVYAIFFMSMVVYGPAVALSFVTGLNHHRLVAVIFIVCIFYSSLGGIKAVLWMDSLQAVIMLVSMAIVVIMGAKNVGGLANVWRIADEGGRINFFNFDIDPRTRHTFWTSIIGGYFIWLPMYANQAQVQRYISLPSIAAARQALVINLIGLVLLMGLCYVGGLVIYANYVGCDPITQYAALPGNLGVKAVDQLLPKFVMDTLSDYPGLPGLFVAGITCAGLSTVSSVVNSLAASITEDYVRKLKPDMSDRMLTIASKLVAVTTGLMGFGFVFIAEQMGNIFSAATSLLGILGGPSLGIFITGMFFPWSNTKGAVMGLCSTFGFMIFLGVGANIYKNKKPTSWLPNQALFLDVTNCSNYPSDLPPWEEVNPYIHWKDRSWDGLTQFFSLSDLWYPAVGCIMTVTLGLFFSFIVSLIDKNSNPPKRSKLFIPLVLAMWMKICPGEMRRLVTFETDDLLDKGELSTTTGSTPSNLDGYIISKDADKNGRIVNGYENRVMTQPDILPTKLQEILDENNSKL